LHEALTERDKARAQRDALAEALRAADYRLADVSNYLGPFDHETVFESLTETIQLVRAALAKVAKP
jgi:hypothetical protein